jgi:hypothetical protein
MQYLLSPEEWARLQDQVKAAKRLPTQEALQNFCTYVADNLVLTEGWYKGKPWGCILTKSYEWYCDDCPARHVCPHEDKEWSK